MAVLSSTTEDLVLTAPTTTASPRDDRDEGFFSLILRSLTGWMCRASRGYLCPPDMHKIMYPDEPGMPESGTAEDRAAMATGARGCCDENLSRK